jgi:glucose/arabinose dehydrogenase
LTGLTTASCGYLAGGLPAPGNPEAQLHQIKLPPGFSIEVWVSGIENARSMTMSPAGTIFVGTRSLDRVYAIPPGTRTPLVIASGLESPNGVAFKNGDLYVAEISRVIKFRNIEANLRHPPVPVVVNETFPHDQAHGWKFIQFGPDGRLYVPVGMPCNICERDDKKYGTIMRMNDDGSGLEIFATGIRNTVGFDWDPRNGELWFTENGRDWLGDDLPPDELNRAPRPGMDFGFPYFFGKNVPDPEFTNASPAGRIPAAQELGAHVAALGMRFYTGTLFPDRYRGGMFIAEHGSWNRSTASGYRVVFVTLRDSTPVSHEVFADGWLQGNAAWGRPVDVLVMPDGALLVSDDKAGALYRITYTAIPGPG